MAASAGRRRRSAAENAAGSRTRQRVRGRTAAEKRSRRASAGRGGVDGEWRHDGFVGHERRGRGGKRRRRSTIHFRFDAATVVGVRGERVTQRRRGRGAEEGAERRRSATAGDRRSTVSPKRRETVRVSR